MSAAHLRQVHAGDGAELNAQHLQVDGDDIGEQGDEEEAELVAGAGGDGGGVVSGVDVGHGYLSC